MADKSDYEPTGTKPLDETRYPPTPKGVPFPRDPFNAQMDKAVQALMAIWALLDDDTIVRNISGDQNLISYHSSAIRVVHAVSLSFEVLKDHGLVDDDGSPLPQERRIPIKADMKHNPGAVRRPEPGDWQGGGRVE